MTIEILVNNKQVIYAEKYDRKSIYREHITISPSGNPSCILWVGEDEGGRYATSPP